MQRFCTKFRCFAEKSIKTSLISSRQLHSSPQLLHQPLRFTSATHKWSLNANFIPTPVNFPLASSGSLLSLVQVRHVSSRERKKRRKPMTPVTSKVKKIKMKSYSSYKSRFRTMKDGSIRRWREGKSHNAHLKSTKAKRRLRKPSTVPVAYAKVMKKLNFCG
ncbi:uncharacterized protein LOC126679901 [Mercurialis annua]|uniref:uncharacterized protein LOC126679901 n=1 Tax=Mercurialis annua TaxID=3986 RepID=UPI002160D1B1|nr:uncharacterized protein LOC126679901 [Mercurialis annua]